MADKIDEVERRVLDRKEAIRKEDRAVVAAGAASWAEMNRANSLATSVIRLYRPRKKLGMRR